MTRDAVSPKDELGALERVKRGVEARWLKHGTGAYASPHEAYGVIAEEFKELLDALHSNDPVEFDKELVDIAVACLWEIASAEARRAVRLGVAA